MRVHMPPQILLPGMQHQGEGQCSTQPARMGGELGQRARGCCEQHLVEGSGALADEAVQIVRQCEHQVEIRYR